MACPPNAVRDSLQWPLQEFFDIPKKGEERAQKRHDDLVRAMAKMMEREMVRRSPTYSTKHAAS
jgi:hypothetical protein